MAITTEATAIYDILALARGLPKADRRWLADLLAQDSDTPLPEPATLEQAIAPTSWMRAVLRAPPSWQVSRAGICKID